VAILCLIIRIEMHISDGIIDNKICIAANVISLGLVLLTARKTRTEEIPKMGMTAAAMFVLSLIHIPLAGTSIHPGLYGLAGVILGKRSFPVVFSVILFQSLIFQHGGLLTIGLNALNMSTGAYLAFIIWKSKFAPEYARAFMAGVIGVIMPVILMAFEFYVTGYGKGVFALFSIYLVVAVAEGIITFSIVKFFRKVKTDIIS
jgi:cobalt/nickel transport system permease protein